MSHYDIHVTYGDGYMGRDRVIQECKHTNINHGDFLFHVCIPYFKIGQLNEIFKS